MLHPKKKPMLKQQSNYQTKSQKVPNLLFSDINPKIIQLIAKKKLLNWGKTKLTQLQVLP